MKVKPAQLLTGQLPFRTLLTVVTATAVAFALLLSCLGVIGLQYRGDRSNAERRYAQIARVITSNIGAAILFGDRAAAQENIASVSGISDIGWVRAFDREGRLIAEFSGNVAEAGSLEEVDYPVLVDGEHQGELRMGVHYRGLGEIAAEITWIALGLFMVCLVMALIVARWLGVIGFRPLDRLLEAMRRITSSGDFSIRLKPEPDPDFHTISASFNTMLAEIEVRNARLSDTAAELLQARDEAQEASMAKSQFLANMSHELRTPLNAIIGYTDVLQEELVEAGLDRSVEDVHWIHSSARQLLTLINGILDLSKIEAGRMDLEVQEFAVAEVLREVTAMLDPIATRKGNMLHMQIDQSVGKAVSDSVKLRQCLLNLGSNACKFTENGHVFILARAEEDDLVFSVSDTGIGITEDELNRLFQPFVQADASTTRRYGGTGLGLTITWRFAELLGGSIAVESVPGEGSTFTLRIKADLQRQAADEEAAELIALPVQAAVQRTSGRPLALIVDDEPSAMQLLARLVDQAGYDAICANGGEEGLAMAQQAKPDLILLDIGMPVVSGWQVLEALADDRHLLSIPTVVVTVDDDRRRALAAGASDHLVKPVDRTELTDILQQYSSRRTGKVLIVEDDLATGRLHERGIAQMGYETKVVDNGRDALAALESANFGFVVTDLRMPHIDGFQLIETISAMPEVSRPRVIVVTGKVLDEDETRQLDGKVMRLLSKNGLSPRKLAENLARASSDPMAFHGFAA
ncbi:response regulator [Sphingomonas mucosissima]|uniref:histidine kinase n=1 Tax=Sphingomonas mucosissima TaxID=370959 RepID=A0A245ZDL3_9SPHN|nr:response regulator [Sphingomonas mucosissima]OWK27855.1 signal transduction histidine-protein kinase BarA [Sphingomonas mucosissima]